MEHSPLTTSSVPLYNSETDLMSSKKETNENITQRKKKRGVDAELQRIETMMQEMKSMFSEFVAQQTQQNNKIDSLQLALEDIKSQNSIISCQNTKIQDTVQFLSDKYDEAILEINNLQTECTNNQKVIKSLEIKVDYLERNLKASTVEISNIPSSNPENRETLIGIVQRLGSIINQPVPLLDIKNIFRSRSKKEAVGTVIVEFSSTSKKSNSCGLLKTSINKT